MRRESISAAIAAFVAVASMARADEAPLAVDADFPGGNIVIDKIEGDHIHVHQDLRDTAGNWFYWQFRVTGAAGRNLTVQFTQSNPIGARGPAVSADGGRTWEWLGREAVQGKSFRCAVPADAKEIRFCFAFPYQDADLQAFIRRHTTRHVDAPRGNRTVELPVAWDNPHLKVESLCRTRKGRNVELLRVGRLDGEAAHRVALTCRHHSCEMMASYALEGIIDEVLSDSEEGKWLREHVEFFIVPMMDKDGVEDGDQGKNRKPHDHNRDYEGDGIYPEVRAVKEKLPVWSAGKLRFAMDMHCPWISGGLGEGGNETVFFVGGPEEEIWREVGRFSKLLEETRTGPIVYDRRNNLPFGKSWNTVAQVGNRKAFSRWAATIPGVEFAATIEIAYANANGKAVTDDSARALGHDLARTLRKHLDAPHSDSPPER
ncbi:MAG: M14 family zinc carboxypeptidase [Planctomycetaceae bacterium]